MKKNKVNHNPVDIAALKSGDSKAIKQWFDHYFPILLKAALYKVSDHHVAEEIVQETFINCLRNMHSFRGDSNLKTWMQSILYHEIADYYRKQYAKKVIHALPLGDLVLQSPVHDAHETAEKVKSTLSKLNAEHMELLQLKYVDKLKVKEISKRLGRSVKAVESDLFRARNAFKTAYNESF